MKLVTVSVLSVVAFYFISSTALLAQTPVGTAFTYQGQLKQAGSPLSNSADFEFRLWDAEVGGNQVGSPVGVTDTSVIDGLFTLQLDFGTGVFTGDARWLETAVRSPAGVGEYVTLTPRQPLKATPYALHALNGADSLWRTGQWSRIYYDAGAVSVGTSDSVGMFHVFSEDEPAITATVSGEDGHGVVVSTTGLGTVALNATSSGPEAKALELTATGLDSVVIDAKAQGETRVAINASATAPQGYYTPPNYAGKFYATEENGVGVFGRVDGGSAYGVYGTAEGSYGRGVFGELTATSGSGVHGVATASSGTTYGVYGRSYSTSGVALYGNASASSGLTYGVFGRSWSSEGRGVCGLASAAAGVNYGVYGETDSPDGYAAYFAGGRNYFEGNVGIGQIVPAAKLHVGGTAGVDGIMFPDGTLQTTAAVGGGGDNLWSASGADIFYSAGNVGVGTSAPIERLHVVGGSLLVDSATGNIQIVYNSTGNGWRFATTGGGSTFLLGDVPGGGYPLSVTNTGHVGIGTLAPAAALHVSGTPGVDGIMFPDGTLQTTAATGGGGDTLWSESGSDIFYEAGNVGVGTSSPTNDLHVVGDTRIDGSVGVSTAPLPGVKLDVAGGTAYGVRATTSSTSATAALAGVATATSGYARGVLGTSSAADGFGVEGVGVGAGVRGSSVYSDGVGVYGEHISSTGDAPGVHGVTNSDGNLAAGVKGEAVATSGGFTIGVMGLAHSPVGMGVYGKADTGSAGMGGYFISESPNGRGVMAVATDPTGLAGFFDGRTYFDGDVGIGTISPAAELDVAGTARVEVLEIVGGADLSENFAIEGRSEPGMVVVIDPRRPGALCTSSSAYDRRVAGVISGAGGVRTGMLMSQTGSVADGEHPVALTGRVYCWCDASVGPIGPGDMLTTSDTPGHAMKVTDHKRAQGAIIGKAMTSLKEGTGLVLVLVNLQ